MEKTKKALEQLIDDLSTDIKALESAKRAKVEHRAQFVRELGQLLCPFDEGDILESPTGLQVDRSRVKRLKIVRLTSWTGGGWMAVCTVLKKDSIEPNRNYTTVNLYNRHVDVDTWVKVGHVAPIT